MGSPTGTSPLPDWASDCGHFPNANVGWSGQETVQTGVPDWPACCDICWEQAFADPPCRGWVYVNDTAGHCYQKYDMGSGVSLIFEDGGGYDAGVFSGPDSKMKLPKPAGGEEVEAVE